MKCKNCVHIEECKAIEENAVNKITFTFTEGSVKIVCKATKTQVKIAIWKLLKHL